MSTPAPAPLTAPLTAQPTQLAVSVKINRADGSVEDHGIVAYHHVDPERVKAFLAHKAAGLIVPLESFFGLQSPSED